MLQKIGKHEPFIYLTGVSYHEMQSMVHFIYLGQTEISQEDLAHFLDIATKFDIKGLAEYNLPDDSQVETEKIHIEPESDLSTTKILESNTDNGAPVEATKKTLKFKREQPESKPETTFTKVKGEVLYCENCDYKTNRSYTLKVHRRARHEGVKLPCDECEAKFAFEHSLSTHKKTKHSSIS